MDVLIHYTDMAFTSRCNLQDCYVIPESIDVSAAVEESASTDVLPKAFLVSPYMLHNHNTSYHRHHHLSSLTLLWRCGACGKEQCVGRDALAPLTCKDNRTGKSGSRSNTNINNTSTTSTTIQNSKREKKMDVRGTSSSSSSRQDPSLCPDCYCCPRCNASVLRITLTHKLDYIACCTYCHWQHETACKNLSDLMTALNASTLVKTLSPYYEAVRDWRYATETSRKATEEASLSISRLAISEYTQNSVETSLHPAIAMENIRESIRKRNEKALCDIPEWVPAFATLEETALHLNRENEKEISCHTLDDKGNKLLQKDSNDALMRITQMEQHGFYLSSKDHPFWKHHGIDSRVSSCFLSHNIRQPLLATVLTSLTRNETRDSDSYRLFLLNGVYRDPSFQQIKQQLITRSGGERRRCAVITMQLAAALHLPILQYRGHRDVLNDSEKWFAWRNFGNEEVIIRRCTIAREVGGSFTSSLHIAPDATESEWVKLPPRSNNRNTSGTIASMKKFSITLDRRNQEEGGNNVMVGFLVEVMTWLPVWQREKEKEENEIYGNATHSFADKDLSNTKRQHIVTYGVTVVWRGRN
ncbi:hypothetical protein LSM04_005079 [Trypanosoma melophagium]|uniref:uncharacterized protein n=1 Tax=Trypanosoma melophagium TaxID=715481 RepID=UPI00351A1436|nr:hypothetical protein LSM04_005079 [Trypanosoma melophagium]